MRDVRLPKTNMINAMVEYKTEHDFGAAASLDGFPEFEAVYERLKTLNFLIMRRKYSLPIKRQKQNFMSSFWRNYRRI